MIERIKSILRDERTFLMVVVMLIGLIAYGLGHQAGVLAESANNVQQPAIVFTAAPAAELPVNVIPVVASRSGTKYHRLDCPGARTIKEANLIRFASIELAESAGYQPARNCDF